MAAASLARRLVSQGLTDPEATTVDDVVARLLAVQAQDPRGARLAVRARSTGLTAADVDAALDDRRLVVSWLNRGTLHLVTADDYWWLHPLTAPTTVNQNASRLEQLGVSPAQAERGVEVITGALDAEGPLTRAELRARVDDAGVPTGGQALVHLLLRASLHGDVVRGPMAGREQAFVSAAAWLGTPPAPLDRTEALARLARRYLTGHAPADARDLAKWAGLPLRDARAGMAALDADAGGEGRGTRRLPSPRLLGQFDPLLHGWASRDDVVGPHGHVVTDNGLFRATALVRGRVVGTWGLARGAVTISYLEDVAPRTRRTLDADGADVLRFLGLSP